MQTHEEYRFTQTVRRNTSSFGYLRGTKTITSDIVSPNPEIWDCELSIAYHDEKCDWFDYNGDKIDMVEAINNAR